MTRYAKKKDNSVVFIGDHEDTEPLLQKAWASDSTKLPNGNRKFKQNRKNGSSSIIKNSAFPNSFLKYLFSQKSVLVRMLTSLCPPFGQFKRIAVDYEGSFLSTFLLTATVFWGLINSGREFSRVFALLHASGLTVGYLVVIAGFTWILSKCTKTAITARQILCILGYGLFGHALVLLICEVGSAEWFMTLMTLIGGLDSVRICLILLSRTPTPAYRFVLCTPVAIIHLLYLVYLHFAIMKT